MADSKVNRGLIGMQRRTWGTLVALTITLLLGVIFYFYPRTLEVRGTGLGSTFTADAQLIVRDKLDQTVVKIIPVSKVAASIQSGYAVTYSPEWFELPRRLSVDVCFDRASVLPTTTTLPEHVYCQKPVEKVAYMCDDHNVWTQYFSTTQVADLRAYCGETKPSAAAPATPVVAGEKVDAAVYAPSINYNTNNPTNIVTNTVDMPECDQDEILVWGNNRWNCRDQSTVTTPPAAYPNCAVGEVLTSMGGVLSCVVVGSSALPPCATNQIYVYDGSAWVCQDENLLYYDESNIAPTTLPSASGPNAVAIGDGAVASGSLAMAFGSNVAAVGTSATAFGSNTTANGNYSLVGGLGSTTSGVGSVAIGVSNTAGADGAVALGQSNSSTGLYAFTSGVSNSASADGAFALGQSNNATGIGAGALGNGNTASADGATALGAGNTASGVGAVAFGQSNTASGSYAVAGGLANQATNTSATAFGLVSQATGVGSVAMGIQATASGLASAAFGSNVNATGDNSFVIGTLSTASGQESFTLGSQNTATTQYDFAIGQNNTASGTVSGAIGFNNINLANQSYILGVQNSIAGVASGSMALGINNQILNGNSYALGNNNIISAGGGRAIGFQTSVNGTFGATIGTLSAVDGFNQTAIGSNNLISGTNIDFNTSKANDEFALILGNSDQFLGRSNAWAVSWNGAQTTYGNAGIPIAVAPANTGRMYFDDGLQKFRCSENGSAFSSCFGASAAATTANNGLTINPANNVQLGGTLIQNTTITNNGFDLIFDGTGNGSGKVASFLGDIDVTGTIDPTRILFSNLAGVNSPSYNPSANGSNYSMRFQEGGNLNFQSDTTNDILHLSNNGFVGIGTGAPVYTLDVVGMMNQSAVLPGGRTNNVHSGDNVIGAGVKGVGFTTQDPITGALGYLFAGDSTSTGGAPNQAGVGLTNSLTGQNGQLFISDQTGSYTVSLQANNGSNNVGTDWVNNSINSYVNDGINGSSLDFSPLLLELDNADLKLNSYQSGRDDTSSFSPFNFLYTDNNGRLMSAPTSALSSLGWKLGGNSGTTAGTNFIGTTDAADLVFKTDNNESMRIGQIGNLSLGYTGGSFVGSNATGVNSFAQGQGSLASGFASFATGVLSSATGDGGIAMGYYASATGASSLAFGTGLNSVGDYSLTMGQALQTSSYGEIALGKKNTSRAALSTTSWNDFDQLFSIGNGDHLGRDNGNAFSMWKDGSFVFNDDNFQNDAPGTEQNVFYFNYGNHDGMGNAQAKRAIRLGSAANSEWDINSSNVGNKSISLGFVNDYDAFPTSISSGQNSITIGDSNVASEQSAIAIGSAATAEGVYSIAIGQGSRASGLTSTAIGYGSLASGVRSNSFGNNAKAVSSDEIALGMYNTNYVPISTNTWQPTDRLLSIGNGDGSLVLTSDAFTILKNGKTGIGYNNFETSTFDSLLQVNGSVLSSPLAGCAGPLVADADGKIICGVPIVGGGTLDSAYDFGGPGAGRIINADSGAFEVFGVQNNYNPQFVVGNGNEQFQFASHNGDQSSQARIAGRGDSALTIQGGATAALRFNGGPGADTGSIQATAQITTYSNDIVMNGSVFRVVNGSTPKFLIDNTGNVGIGNTTPGYLLHVGNPALSTTDVARFQNNVGTCTVTPGVAGGILCTSDIRAKKNIADLPYASVLDKISGIAVKEYNMKADAEGTRKQVGFIAQNLENIFPSMVITDRDGKKAVSYAAMTPILTAAVNELNVKVDANQATINSALGIQTAALSTVITNIQNKGDSVEGMLAALNTNDQNFLTQFDTLLGSVAVQQDSISELLAALSDLQLDVESLTARVASLEQNQKKELTGRVKIKKGDTKATIDFASSFSADPIITLTPYNFVDGKYAVSNLSKGGFNIKLSVDQDESVTFDWRAVEAGGADSSSDSSGGSDDESDSSDGSSSDDDTSDTPPAPTPEPTPETDPGSGSTEGESSDTNNDTGSDSGDSSNAPVDSGSGDTPTE